MDFNSIVAAGAVMTAPVAVQTTVKYAREAGLPTKYAPLAAVVVGIAIAVPAAITAGVTWYFGVSAGIMLGLVSAGGYSAAKKSVDNTDNSAV